MKAIIILFMNLSLLQIVVAGPWYSHALGIANGDKIENAIPVEERIYIFLRRAPSENKRDDDVPIKILHHPKAQTIADVVETMKDSYPETYPKSPFVVVYRIETGGEAAYQASIADARKAKFKVRPRDVIWIGFSL